MYKGMNTKIQKFENNEVEITSFWIGKSEDADRFLLGWIHKGLLDKDSDRHRQVYRLPRIELALRLPGVFDVSIGLGSAKREVRA